MEYWLYKCFIYCLLQLCRGTIHNLTLEKDVRSNVALSTFGFSTLGKLQVHLSDFHVADTNLTCGFSLQKTINTGVSSYMEKNTRECIIDTLTNEKNPRQNDKESDLQMIVFKFDLVEEKIIITRKGSEKFRHLKIDNEFKGDDSRHSNMGFFWSHANLMLKQEKDYCKDLKTPNNITEISMISTEWESGKNYSAKFTIYIDCHGQEGLYNLYFHNCQNYIGGGIETSMEIYMIESNYNTYLSTGEIPLPLIYVVASLGFFIIAVVWTMYLRQHRLWTYKVHWLMAVVVYFKSLSVALHAMNFYYTGRYGHHVQTWAILYYMIHLLKGALLFATIVLIGTGYFFVKHVLSKKERNLFMIVIPLQIIANVAQIIIDSTEEAETSYRFWSNVAFAVDLLCCGAILLPVIWSIKHLSEAAKTDGKAAISLQKLKLFRHFYVMIVCYIYFTRIVVYLIKVTVPFQFMWLDEFFTEAATFIFFFITGYKFRPANNNPYLQLPQQEPEDDIEMNEISEHSAFGERIKRVNKVDNGTRST